MKADQPGQPETATIRRSKVRAYAWGVLVTLSGVLLLSVGFTVFRESGLYFTIAIMASALNVLLFGLSFIRAGNALRLAQRQPHDAAQLLAVLPHFAPPLILQVLALGAVSFLVAVVIAIGVSDLKHARYRAQQKDLENVRLLQDDYWSKDHNADGAPDHIYADGLSKLPGFKASRGVRITIIHGSRAGWAAVSSHQAMSGKQGCAIFNGIVPDPPVTLGGRLAQRMNEAYCDQD